MRKRIRTISNVPTRELLLMMAQANSMGCPYVDLIFDDDTKMMRVQPISPTEVTKRFDDGTPPLTMEDIIDDEL